MLKKLHVAVFAFVAMTFAMCGNAPAQDAVTLPAKSKLHLYLLVGQSNMAGRGTVEDEDRVVHPRIITLTKEATWVPAVDPLHFDKPTVVGVGLGKSFAKVLAERDPNVTIGLIPCAVGGSPIDAWQPGVYYEPTQSHPWDDALARAKQAMQDGELKGILWHQGESDAKDVLAQAYAGKLHELIASFRDELVAPDVPFIVGQMGQFPEKPWDEFHRIVDAAHRDLPQHIARTSFVSSEGLMHRGDKVHFDSAAYRELGRRYADAYLKSIDSK